MQKIMTVTLTVAGQNFHSDVLTLINSRQRMQYSAECKILLRLLNGFFLCYSLELHVGRWCQMERKGDMPQYGPICTDLCKI